MIEKNYVLPVAGSMGAGTEGPPTIWWPAVIPAGWLVIVGIGARCIGTFIIC